MLFRSLVYSLLATLLSGCLLTAAERPEDDLKPLVDTNPWQARGKMLVSSENERQTLRFIWSHLSEEQDRIELSDSLGLRSIILIRDSDEYYQENTQGHLILLSANTLEEPLAAVLSSLPSDISRLMTGAKSADNRVTSEVVSWSTSAKFATPEVLRVHFGDYGLKIMINQWDIGSSE
ncbi:MAG: lipoprotein insertase outer membrane protein LolB [Pseudomonadota bacterium]|nr:lipoprotein insertase outer membrane protein LolB [Pseudomonadota bacterium]